MYAKNPSDAVVQKKFAAITKVQSVDSPIHHHRENTDNGDVYYACKPFYALLELFGLQKIRFKRGDNRRTSGAVRAYSFLLALVVLGVQSYCIHVKTYTTYAGMSSASVITDLLDTIPGTFSAIVCLVMSATCNQRMILRVFNNFTIVDKKLAIEKTNVYGPLRTRIVAVMALLVLVTVFHYAYEGLFWTSFDKISVGFFISIIKELILLEVTLLIFVDADRLDTMNAQLENLKHAPKTMPHEEIYSITKKGGGKEQDAMTIAFLNQINAIKAKDGSGEEQVDELTRLMRIYDRLVDNANIVNSCYGIQMLTACIAAFVNILRTVNELISVKKAEDSEMIYASAIFWCLRDLFFVTVAIISCERLQSKVKDTSDIINKLSIDPKMDADEQELLERFSQLIACRRTAMTACNFFPFDFTFIYSLVGAVATYTVILLQVNQGKVPGVPTGGAANGTTMNTTEDVAMVTTERADM